MTQTDDRRWRATTICMVRHKGQVVVGGDGQVSLGQTVMLSLIHISEPTRQP